MKSFIAAALLFAGLLAAHAQSDADDRYIGIYGLIQQADQFAASGEPGEALAAYGDAQAQLQQFQKMFPNWNPIVVSFRLNHVAEKIANLKNRVSGAATTTATNVVTNARSGAASSSSSQLTTELDNLRSRLQAVQADNDLLQAKLKEALATQPAAIDSRELTRAREQIRWLMKENDLLKISHGGVMSARPQTVYVTNFTTVYITNGPVEVTNLAAVFAKNTGPLVVTNYIRTVMVDTNAMERLRQDRDAAVKNLSEEHTRAEQLAGELEKLKDSASLSATNDSRAYAVLLAENTSLKAALSALRSVADGGADAGKLTKELKQAQAQIIHLQSEAEITALEKATLERKLQELSSPTNSSVSVVAYESRLRELAQERNDLIERLDAANKQKPGKNSEAPARLSALNREVAGLRSRLAVLEARPVPYTAEELALLKGSTPQPANPAAGKQSVREMPAGSMELVSSAQQHFARHEYDQAEADYQKILDRDQNNGIALANLATIELQQGKLADAEKHIQTALAQSPDDAFNLCTLGLLKFQEQQYDAALDALSRAAKIDPNNPEIQNYLGMTLSQLGQRKPAEAALRRAIEISPNYASAHNNLAVIYLSQQPPLPELARWHYQKALDAGQPRNPDLERMLAEKGAPVGK